jgi:DNA polymerase I-like protein with 3'-5' exonuclease and polymerase domains
MNPYKQIQAQTDTPAQLNKKIFASIRMYLQAYKDTSSTKQARLESLEKAKIIVEHIVIDLNPRIQGIEADILYFGFLRISQKISVALIDTSHVYDVNDEIGFLTILEK